MRTYSSWDQPDKGTVTANLLIRSGRHVELGRGAIQIHLGEHEIRSRKAGFDPTPCFSFPGRCQPGLLRETVNIWD